MKKFAAIALAASMFALAACGDETPAAPSPSDPPKESPEQPCAGPGEVGDNCDTP